MARKITFMQAINEAMAEEMRRDPSVFVFGEDVRVSAFGQTAGITALGVGDQRRTSRRAGAEGNDLDLDLRRRSGGRTRPAQPHRAAAAVHHLGALGAREARVDGGQGDRAKEELLLPRKGKPREDPQAAQPAAVEDARRAGVDPSEP